MTGEDSGSYSKTCYKLKGYPESEFQRWVEVLVFSPFGTLWLSLKKRNINSLVCPKNEFQKDVAVMILNCFNRNSLFDILDLSSSQTLEPAASAHLLRVMHVLLLHYNFSTFC